MTRTMLVASPGGHLDELRILVEMLNIDQGDAVWVTGRTAQTESLLADREVVWIPRVGSGQMRKAAMGLPMALRIQRRIRPDLLVSTGALFSTPHLMAASLLGCETWFIDSATRVDGPSRTGVFARHLTRAKLFVQGDGWGDPRWTPVPSVFDTFQAQVRAGPTAPHVDTAVVSLGTELWPFRRAVDAALDVLSGTKIVWQTGVTEVTRDGALLQQWLPAAELHRAFEESVVVVTHAGVGSVLAALDRGKVPVILPRQAAHGEMIDDHQVEFSRMITARSLAVSVDPDEMTLDHVHRAARQSVRRRQASR